MLYNNYLTAIRITKEKIHDLYNALKINKMDKSYANLAKEQISHLVEENENLKNLNMSLQKEIYSHSQDLTLSHSLIRFPLNKLLNSLYDDLWVEVLFYDNICSLQYNYIKLRKNSIVIYFLV